MSCGVDGGTITQNESSGGGTSLGETLGLFPGSSLHAFVLELGIGWGDGRQSVAIKARTLDSELLGSNLSSATNQLCHVG